MAGGRFDKLVGKVRPGTYINFESGRETDILSAGTRGTVIVPLPKAAYGPAKQFIRLTNASPDAEAATLGYSIYDSDPNRQMLLIRAAPPACAWPCAGWGRPPGCSATRRPRTTT